MRTDVMNSLFDVGSLKRDVPVKEIKPGDVLIFARASSMHMVISVRMTYNRSNIVMLSSTQVIDIFVDDDVFIGAYGYLVLRNVK